MNPEQPSPEYSPFDTIGAPGEQVPIGETTQEGRQVYIERALNNTSPSKNEVPRPPTLSIGDKINTYVRPADHTRPPARLSADINEPTDPTSKG